MAADLFPPLDPRVLERVRNALIRLPDSARNRHYYEIPGDRLATPRHPDAQ
ncbi:MAG TPA: hypothetical protein VH478_24470 [Trebonia sp.]|nr:hypothetical protein [Trebonia sp.]